MKTVSPYPDPAASPVAWWRVPTMWLVVGGPLAVVLASIATVAIALRHPDPVLDRRPDNASARAERAPHAPPAPQALLPLLPAQEARNHAASPRVPETRP